MKSWPVTVAMIYCNSCNIMIYTKCYDLLSFGDFTRIYLITTEHKH